MKNYLFIFLLFFVHPLVNGQTDRNNQPASFQFDPNDNVQLVAISPQPIPIQPSTTEPSPLLAGYTVSLDKNITELGHWEQPNSGLFVWRLSLQIEHAAGLNLYFKDFDLGEEERIFIYSKDKSVVRGAFTKSNNGKYFVTDFVPGSQITIELNTNRPYRTLPFHLSELGISVNRQAGGGRDFGDSQFCEVPVNCPEGDDWQNEKRGVARILVKQGSSLFWCTGTLVNNTRNDKTPYFLTANHCGQLASEADYAAWKFYFDFESTDCERPVFEPESVKLTGSALLAKSPDNTNTGSDFKLLLLTDEIPEDFYPWYNGWDWSGEVSPSGVCINHPEGDIKMISTYTQAVVSTRYNNPTPDENGIYWKVNWAETQNGYGVTEGGSSGSPLLNPAGNIIGSLTGGQASCSFPEQPDYYGKFSYSWESNGSDSTRQLKYWLDPENTGVLSLKGADFDTSAFYADFTADVRKIKIGETVQFTNRSSGNINNYEWFFPGGEPSSFTGENPPQIRYTTAGSFDVKLTVSSSSGIIDVKLDKAYIQVTPSIYPNPSTGKITISFGKEGADFDLLQIYAFDITGREINFFAQPADDSSAVVINLSTQRRGVYLLRIIADGKTQVLKVIVAR